jgi:hypothetical protein
MLSPRRVKPAPVVVMYELRSLRAAKPLAAMRAVEARIKKWRGLVRWTMMAYASPRAETVVHIVGERHSHVSRRDNLFSSWQRLVKVFGGVDTGRAAWVTATTGASYFADARILLEGYEAATAKVLEEAKRFDEGVAACSDSLPLLPVAAGPAPATVPAPRTSASSAATRMPTSQPKTVVLDALPAAPSRT